MTDAASPHPESDADFLVRARGVRKSFGPLTVLKGIDLDVRHGETVVILGPSGSGKSTLLRCINHLERIDAGSITVGGEQIGFVRRGGVLHELPEHAIARQRRSIGMVFQSFNLYPHMTALENVVEAPIGVHGEPRAAAEAHGLELLARVGLASDSQKPAWPSRP